MQERYQLLAGTAYVCTDRCMYRSGVQAPRGAAVARMVQEWHMYSIDGEIITT